MYARIAVYLAARALNCLLTYRIPEHLRNQIKLGCVVEIPLRSSAQLGVVVELVDELTEEEEKFQLRDVVSLLDSEPFWGEELMSLVQIMRTLYASTWFESFQTVVPGPVLHRLKAMWLKKRVLPERKGAGIKKTNFYPEIPLTSVQERAVETICHCAENGKPVLLYGVTGSGKTEVYLRVLQHFLQKGKSGIVLVPELSLTPQAIERYCGRLGDCVGVLHSALSVTDRRNFWWAMRRQELSVALGTRSAIFAPFQNIGVICIDEEHESSYKQENQPRYHARQVAFMRAKEQGAALVLGSATPSLESFYLANKGAYTLIELPQRPGGKALPRVRIVDMRLRHNAGKVVSRELAQALKMRLENGEQSVLLLNRRGFANFIQCPECGFVYTCPNCTISLTWHKISQSMRCHYCDFKQNLAEICPQCQSKKFKYGTPGTERLSQELGELFPQAKISRLDRDTVGKIGSHARILQEFASGETQILLGTKMVAKGLDFPNVTLVGVLQADAELNIPDFRANERTFQLLSQAAGRAGRGAVAGEVILQAYDADNKILQAVVNHDYRSMYESELAIRKEMLYPPFSRLVRLILTGKDDDTVQEKAFNLGQILRENEDGFTVLGPAPCPIEKIKGKYRWHILLKSSVLKNSINACSVILDRFQDSKGNVQIVLDIEPQSLV